jgi:hypothetical protein
MFFFIAGIQPRTFTEDEHPRMCPSCGLYRARMKRVDHYFSVFFLPLFRVKKGLPVLWCDRCGLIGEEGRGMSSTREQDKGGRCPRCGSPLNTDFRFCPYCGQKAG